MCKIGYAFAITMQNRLASGSFVPVLMGFRPKPPTRDPPLNSIGLDSQIPIHPRLFKMLDPPCVVWNVRLYAYTRSHVKQFPIDKCLFYARIKKSSFFVSMLCKNDIGLLFAVQNNKPYIIAVVLVCSINYS